MAKTFESLGTLQTGAELMRTSCELEQLAEDATKPSWIHMLPAGPSFDARDGRKFSVENLEAIAANSELPMLIDWEHASEAGDTRAAGWVDELKVEPATAGDKAGLWGRATWTPQGREHVSTRSYRYLSPVVLGKRALSEGAVRFHVEKLRSIALTNRPALKMHGIESLREQLSHTFSFQTEQPEDDMNKLRLALCTAFGLAPDSDEDAIASALKPALERLSKPADESAREALSTLTAELNSERQEKAQLKAELAKHAKKSARTEVLAFFDKGSREGKITPAQRGKWLEFCTKSPDNFRTFSEVIYPQLEPIGQRAPKSSKTTSSKLRFNDVSPNGVDRSALRAIGLTEAQILEAEADVFAPREKSNTGAADGADDEDDDSAPPSDGDSDDDGDDADADASDDNDDAAPKDDAAPAQTGG
jgi:phage I-like protein